METLHLTDDDGIEITWYRWAVPEPRAVLHVLHGWAEHAGRYERFAHAANGRGVLVVADDHRGHGRTGLAAEGGLGDLGPRGMDGVLDATRKVSEAAFADHPGVPRFVLGHSWGSFLLQRYLRRWGSELAGAILTGTTYRAPGAAPRGGALNDRFEPAATAYDWLSRDAAEVQRYVDDPWCGFERMATRPAATSTAAPIEPDDSTIPADLPVLILNGADDPIGGAEGGQALADHYRAAGLRNVTFTAYEGGRHELLNETNRDEVTADLLGWLEVQIA
jgi:alpha-beta hydrolase superfamily lysophospholipase